MDAKNVQRARSALRVAGLAAFLGYFFRQRALLQSVWTEIARAEVGYWVAAVGALLLTLAVNAWRLSLIVRLAGARAPWLVLYGDAIVGMALNAVTLMGVGDGYRVHRLVAASETSAIKAAACVVIDRSLGVGLLMTTGLAALLIGGDAPWQWSEGWVPWVASVTFAVLVGLLLRMRDRIVQAWTTLRASPARLVLAPYVLFSGMAAVFSWIGSIYLLTRSLALVVPIAQLCYVGPLVTVATLLPVSIGGLGVREAGYALLLPGNVAGATALGLLQYSTYLVVCVVSVVLLVVARGKRDSRRGK